MSELLCFGLGYSAAATAALQAADGWRISGTSTSVEGAHTLEREGYRACVFDGHGPSETVRGLVKTATHVLVSAPPDHAGDPVLLHHARDLANAPRLEWIGYLSTIGVYGDHRGAWVDETTPAHPSSQRSIRRLEAENAWIEFSARTGRRLQIFRLAGIYGPGRSPLDAVRAGTARRIIKPGQVFNRIHVDDIAAAVRRGMAGAGTHTVYNVTDDLPAPPQDVVAFAASLLGAPEPPELTIEQANLSSMAASFYAENKRVRNDRLKQDLGVALSYPTYREGLRSLVTRS